MDRNNEVIRFEDKRINNKTSICADHSIFTCLIPTCVTGSVPEKKLCHSSVIIVTSPMQSCVAILMKCITMAHIIHTQKHPHTILNYHRHHTLYIVSRHYREQEYTLNHIRIAKHNVTPFTVRTLK